MSAAPFVGFIPATDLARAREFYEATLGLTVRDLTPEALVLDAHGVVVRGTQVAELAPRPFTVAGWTVADIRAAVQTLSGRGVTFTRYEGIGQDDLGIWTTPSGDRVAWFTDPAGNTLSLTEWRPGDV